MPIPPAGEPQPVMSDLCREQFAGTLRLHLLIREGRGDSAEADAIREEGEAAWCELSEREQRLCGTFSAYLYGFDPFRRGEAVVRREARVVEDGCAVEVVPGPSRKPFEAL
jgi:hypothetical protein